MIQAGARRGPFEARNQIGRNDRLPGEIQPVEIVAPSCDQTLGVDLEGPRDRSVDRSSVADETVTSLGYDHVVA